ncbi:polysaccharide pyruvyl transferase family protein [Streptomyces broussonetiae]|uniref:Polysaccharide pyruvyl transferase family protein n=1 Tax=Streptomyces broussonetiae TaxID=2686304 RepID=A0ABV5E3V5_9ACTN
MKRILIQAGNDPFSVPTLESTLVRNHIRGNVGNLMYTNAVYKHLYVPGKTTVQVDTTPFAELTVADAARINAECDIFVIPMANAFKKKFVRHLGILADLIKKLKVPVVVIGVGAQATLSYDTEFLAPVNSAVKRFIGAVLDHSASIGVRGEFTKRYLGELGFKDVDVIGCPSVYFRGPDFRMDNPAGRALPENARIALSTALRLANAEHASAINAAILEQYPDLTYFAQESRDLQTLYWGDTSVVGERHAPMPDLGSHPLLRSADVCVPLEPHSWIDVLKEYDFAVGTRIHGNIAALAAGTPAYVFAHDSRTLELAQYHHIPHKVLSEVPADVDVAKLYAETDYSAFNEHYDEGFQRLLAFLTKNGFENTYDHGDGGAEYDRKVAATTFTEPYRRTDDHDQADLLFRMTLLREQLVDSTAKAEKKAAAQAARIKKLETQIADQEDRISAIEAQVKGGIPGRSRGIMKRLSSK